MSTIPLAGPVRVAVDAMGGDHAPGVVVEGAVEAAREGAVRVLLVGRAADVRAELERLGAEDGLVERDPQVVPEVAPLLRARAARSSGRRAAEEGVEDVREAAEPLGTAGTEPAITAADARPLPKTISARAIRNLM